MDVYRVDGDVKDLNLDEYFYGKGVSIIEWGEMLGDLLPDERLDIIIKVTGEDKRTIILKPYGKKYEDICEAIA